MASAIAELAAYPEGVSTPDLTDEAAAEEALAAEGAATTYLMTEANITLDRDPFALDAVSAAQFTVDATSFGSAADGTKLAVIEAHYTPGGPKTVLSMHYDAGTYQHLLADLFLAASVLLFAIHLPLLDRAETKRKEFLIGGTAARLVRPRLGGEERTMLGLEVPLLEQGSVQFILFVVMILAVVASWSGSRSRSQPHGGHASPHAGPPSAARSTRGSAARPPDPPSAP